MAVPETLAPYTDMLRSDVTRADSINWKVVHASATDHVAGILGYVKADPLIDEACAAALARCQEYADEIGEHRPPHSLDDAASKQAQELALLAIRELEQRLEFAKPSEEAVCLGLGWQAA